MFDISIIKLLSIFFVVFITTLVLIHILLKYSYVLKLMDMPNQRSIHSQTKSRAGGIAIFFSFLLGVILLNIDVDIYVALSFFLVFLLGVYDDIFNSSSRLKFIVLIISAICLYLGGFSIDSLGVFLGYDLTLPSLVAAIFFVFAVVGFINAMNLIDGLDGLSSGVAIMILLGYMYLGYKYNDMFVFYVSSLLIITLVAFLVYNWYPSKLFMGDSGSLTLGFVIAVLSIYSIQMEYVTPVTVLLLTAVPILDTLIVMIRRIRNGKNPFHPDKSHIHHIILKQHYSNVPKTVKILVLLQAVFVYIGLGFKVRDDLIILIVFIMLFVLFYTLLTPKKFKKKKKRKTS